MAVEQMKDLGLTNVLIGHSERRGEFGIFAMDNNDTLATKLQYILDAGMTCVFCIGEPKPIREQGLEAVLAEMDVQLKNIYSKLDAAKVVIAYEPVWAIGTGLTATPEDAQATHKGIRELIAKNASADVAENIRIQYGGSANAKNAPELSAQPDVDGFLVGGASLKPEFAEIVAAISTAKSAEPAESAAPAAKSAVPIAINGFGRIGRQVARIAMKDPECDLKLINASYDPEYLAYMMKYDTIHGRYEGTVEAGDGCLVIDGKEVALSSTRDPADIPFDGAYVCESTGVFLTAEKVEAHLKAGAKKVVFSAPAKDDSHTIVMGVNQETYDPSMTCVSCASCTTNGLAPTVKALHDKFGIKRGLMTTIHAMTASQPTVDSTSKKDWRGGRAASGNIIPSSTGAAKAVAKVIPAVKGKLTGMAFRVPTIDVSVVDLTCELEKETTYEEICAEIKSRSEGDMKGFLGYCDEPLVSTDFETCTTSSTFDSSVTSVTSLRSVTGSCRPLSPEVGCKRKFSSIAEAISDSDEDLEDVGLFKLGHQKRFLLAVKRIKELKSGRRAPSYPTPQSSNGSSTFMPNNGSCQQQQQPRMVCGVYRVATCACHSTIG